MELYHDVMSYVNLDITISPKTLIKDLLPKYYPVSDIVLDAAEYFADIIRKKEFCVKQDKLSKYGILSVRSDRNNIDGNLIKILLDQYNLVENVDYLRRNVPSQIENVRGGGTKHTMQYTLTPKAFFICLVRSKNSSEYAIYYFHVLEIYDYYESYYRAVLEKENAKQKNTIEELILCTKQQNELIREQNSKLDKQSVDSKILQDKLDRQSEDNKTIQCQLTDLQVTMNKIVSKLDNCTEYPSDDKLSERFVIMKNSENVYYVIRRQEKNLRKSIKEKENEGYIKLDDIIESETIPNSVYLWNVIRDELKKERKIVTKYNTFELKINEEDLIAIIKAVFDRRKEY